MGSIIGFSLLGIIVLASIIVSTVAYSRQQANALRKSQIRQIKHKMDGYEDMLASLLRIDREYELILIVNQQIIGLINKLIDLEPENEEFLQLQEEAQINHTAFQNGKRTQEVSTAFETDQEINSANYQLLQVSKLLVAQKKKGTITPAKASELYNHIKTLRLNIDVDSHIAQADSYEKNNDRIMAQSHLKQARETLKQSSIEFPDKKELIKELSERIKRLAGAQDSSSSKDETEQKPKDETESTSEENSSNSGSE